LGFWRKEDLVGGKTPFEKDVLFLGLTHLQKFHSKMAVIELEEDG